MEYKNRNKSNAGLGSVYYSKQKDRWICQTYERDLKTGDRKIVRKTFRTKEKAEQYFTENSLQKNSTLYIEYNGIYLGKLIDFLLEKKYSSNLITDRGYARTKDTIRIISKCYLANKKINNISSEELQ